MTNARRPLRTSLALPTTGPDPSPAQTEFDMAMQLLGRKFVALREQQVGSPTTACVAQLVQLPSGEQITIMITSGALVEPALQLQRNLILSADSVRNPSAAGEQQPDGDDSDATGAETFAPKLH